MSDPAWLEEAAFAAREAYLSPVSRGLPTWEHVVRTVLEVQARPNWHTVGVDYAIDGPAPPAPSITILPDLSPDAIEKIATLGAYREQMQRIWDIIVKTTIWTKDLQRIADIIGYEP